MWKEKNKRKRVKENENEDNYLCVLHVCIDPLKCA